MIHLSYKMIKKENSTSYNGKGSFLNLSIVASQYSHSILLVLFYHIFFVFSRKLLFIYIKSLDISKLLCYIISNHYY